MASILKPQSTGFAILFPIVNLITKAPMLDSLALDTFMLYEVPKGCFMVYTQALQNGYFITMVYQKLLVFAHIDRSSPE